MSLLLVGFDQSRYCWYCFGAFFWSPCPTSSLPFIVGKIFFLLSHPMPLSCQFWTKNVLFNDRPCFCHLVFDITDVSKGKPQFWILGCCSIVGLGYFNNYLLHLGITIWHRNDREGQWDILLDFVSYTIERLHGQQHAHPCGPVCMVVIWWRKHNDIKFRDVGVNVEFFDSNVAWLYLSTWKSIVRHAHSHTGIYVIEFPFRAPSFVIFFWPPPT